MSYYAFKNNLKTTLHYDMTDTDTVIWLKQIVTSADPAVRLAAWPTCDTDHTFTLTLTDSVTDTIEIVKCTEVTANEDDYLTFSCQRAQEGTAAIAHAIINTSVEHRLTAKALNTVSDSLSAHEAKNVEQDARLTAVEAVTTLVTTTPGAGNIPKADAHGKLTTWVESPVALTGAYKNLKGSATGTSTGVSYTMDEIVVKNSSNVYLTLRNLSLTWNAAGVGVANGIDTGSIAANTWYYVHVIHNPSTSTTALLISLSSTAPTLPNGYTYFARVGAIRWGASYPLRFTQYGNKVQYSPAAGTNVTEFPTIASGALGTWTSSVYTPVATSVSAFVPPTASEIDFFGWNGGGGVAMAAGMNGTGGGWGSATTPLFQNLANNSATLTMVCSGILESSNIYLATASTGPVFKCRGWRDSI